MKPWLFFPASSVGLHLSRVPTDAIHNPFGFSLWLAGGGLKKGYIHGQTDEYGYRVVEKAQTVHDLHATVLHLLGLDFENLTYRFGGRDFRLTDVHGHLISDILA